MKNINEILNSLNIKKQELEEKIETEQISSLSVLLTSYSNLLQNNKTILLEFMPEEYSNHSNTIKKITKKINEKSKQLSLEEPTAYSENINLQPTEEEDLFEFGKRRVNEYLGTAIDSLDNIRRQGRILENAQSKISDGLRKMGVSERVIDNISSRYRNDYALFLLLVIFIILLYFFVFKY